MSVSVSAPARRSGIRYRFGMALRRDWQLWVLLLPCLAFFIIFCYFPMYGVQIAFRDYKAAFGITGSQWVGLKYFVKFFNSYYCGRMFANTFLLNFFGLLFGFPIPILLAIMLNQLNKKHDIQTYQEINAFMEGSKLDELQKAVEAGKRPYQKGLNILTYGVGVAVGLLLYFLLRH